MTFMSLIMPFANLGARLSSSDQGTVVDHVRGAVDAVVLGVLGDLADVYGGLGGDVGPLEDKAWAVRARAATQTTCSNVWVCPSSSKKFGWA